MSFLSGTLSLIFVLVGKTFSYIYFCMYLNCNNTAFQFSLPSVSNCAPLRMSSGGLGNSCKRLGQGAQRVRSFWKLPFHCSQLNTMPYLLECDSYLNVTTDFSALSTWISCPFLKALNFAVSFCKCAISSLTLVNWLEMPKYFSWKLKKRGLKAQLHAMMH